MSLRDVRRRQIVDRLGRMRSGRCRSHSRQKALEFAPQSGAVESCFRIPTYGREFTLTGNGPADLPEPPPADLVDRFHQCTQYLETHPVVGDQDIMEKDRALGNRVEILRELVHRFSVPETALILGIDPQAVEEGLRHDRATE